MFKRVEKRRRKKEEEEELGLDEDMKEILGIQETDSEESASDSDDDHSDSDSSDGGEGMEGKGVGGEDEGDGDEEGESADEDDGEGEEEEEDPNVTVSQALKDPVYVVSVLPEVKACIICPGKLLKGAKMVQTHRESNGHKRRLKRFMSISAESDPNESAWDVLKQHAEEKPKLSMDPSTPGLGLSKRAERKKAQQARRLQLREKRKEKRKKFIAKKAQAENSGTESKSSSKPKSSLDSNGAPKQPKSPPKKKRKVDTETNLVGESPSKTSSSKKSKHDASTTKNEARNRDSMITPLPSTNPASVSDKIAHPITTSPTKNEESVTKIVRSTANRAKTARDRALNISKSAKGVSRGKKPSRRKAVEIS